MITPDRDESIEQAYFFRTFRERMAETVASQDILSRMPEELLTTTKLPMAVEFLATELKHSGLLGSGFAKLPHYFTPFQTFVIQQSEDERRKFTTSTALLVLEREARYKSEAVSQAGLFVYQFESIARNKLGYDEGLAASGGDPFFDEKWREYIDLVRRSVGAIEFSDLVYARSDQYVLDQRRKKPDFVPRSPPLFQEKEGKIAKASRGRDPLFLFAALQRQLGYPEVPRTLPQEDIWKRLEVMQVKLKEMDARLRITEAELRGTFDPTLLGKPELLDDLD